MIISSSTDWVELKVNDALLVLTYAEYRRAVFRGKCRKRAQQNQAREIRKARMAELAEPFPKF